MIPPTTTSRRTVLGALAGGAAATVLGSSVANASPATQAWLSGSGDDTHQNNAGGGFGRWRGEKLTYATIWTYPEGWASRDQVAVSLFTDAGYDETLNLSIGWPEGASWGQAASGGLDSYFTNVARTLDEDWGSLRSVHLSFAFEFNGTWMPWSLNGQLAEFTRAWHRWVEIIRKNTGDRDIKIVLPFSADTHDAAGASVSQVVKSVGPQAFDILGVDYYSAWPDLVDEKTWDEMYEAQHLGPRGLGAWQQYAESINKPFCLPEWGLSDRQDRAPSDNPFFMRKMNDFFRTHAPSDANKPAGGQLAGEALFNTWDQCRIWPETNVSKAAAQYRSLTWGR